MPLSQIIAENYHKNTVIHYLKVYITCILKNCFMYIYIVIQIDIKGSEFSDGGFGLNWILDWIKSGALKNVRQMALEFYLESKPEHFQAKVI